MKSTILLICLAVFGANLRAQTTEFDQLYSAFRGEEGVINIYIPGFLCRMAANIAELDKEEKELLRSIKSVKLMIIENDEINRQLNLVTILSKVERDQDVYSLLEIHDADEDVLILAREEGKSISELYVIVGGDENVMIRITGRINRDLMKDLYTVTGIEQTRYTKEI